MGGKTTLDRVTGLVFALLGLGAMWHAQGLQVAFSSDPVGPKAFPTIVGGIMLLAGAVLVIRPHEITWNGGRWPMVALVAAASLIYPLLLIPLGFIVATSLLLIVIARALKGGWGQSVAAAVALSAGIFLLIDTILGLPLPTGPLGF